MKNLEVKNYNLQDGPDKNLTTKDLIDHCLRTIPEGGFSMDDVLNRTKIQQAVLKADTQISLEDSDVTNLKAYAKAAKWGVFHPDLVLFLTEINNL